MEIDLTQGKSTIVDEEDYGWLFQWKWTAHSNKKQFYAERAPTISRGKQIVVRMHNVIWEHHYGEIPEGHTVDHIDLDGLNNQKQNFRLATPSQQVCNQELRSDNTSGFKGVYRNKKSRNWRAQIQANGKRLCLGSFDDQIEAAHVYDEAAIQYYGEFAVLNFPG